MPQQRGDGEAACFGPLSSVFDFATFAVMLWVFHSGPVQFRTGWFVESLATQTLVIMVMVSSSSS